MSSASFYNASNPTPAQVVSTEVLLMEAQAAATQATTAVSGLTFSQIGGVAQPSQGGTGLNSSGTAGNVLLAGPSFSVGKVDLTQHITGVLPIGNAISGQWTLLNTLTASNSSALQDTTSFTSSYNVYVIFFEDLLPATASVSLLCKVQVGGSFLATGYVWSMSESNCAGGANYGNSSDTTFPIGRPSVINNAAPGLTGMAILYTPGAGSAPKRLVFQTTHSNTSGTAVSSVVNGQAYNTNTGLVTGLQIAASAGNITSGKAFIYGIKP